MLPKIPLVRSAIEKLYDGVATIEEVRKRKNEKNIMVTEWVAAVTDLPCRVSYKTLAPAVGVDTADTITQVITLFTSPDVIVLPGSRITVRQRGREMKFSCSGISAVYDSHQEIPMTRREEHP